MIRSLPGKFGVINAVLAITAFSTLCSVFLYSAISLLIMGRFSHTGLITAVIIPVIIAPPTSIFFMKFVTDLDITKKALGESEERYRSILEAAPDSITITRLEDGRYLEVNEAFCELSGYSREEALGKTPADLDLFVNPEDRERLLHILSEKGEVANFDIRYRMRDGTVHDTILSAKPLRYGDEDCLIAIATVITERKRAEEALRESELKFRTLVDSANDSIFIMNDSVFIDCNRKTLDMFCCTKEDIIGRSPVAFSTEIQPDGRLSSEKATEKMNMALKGNPQFFEWKHRRMDGTPFDAEVSLNRVELRDHTYLQAIVRDITKRRRAEEEREKLREHLDRAQKMESIGTLAGGIAHNFNNVLMGLQGRASLMMMDKDTAHPDYEHLKGIEEYVRSAAELTRDLLGFARGGKYEVKPTDLNALIKHENRMFGSTKKEIRVHGKYETDLWAVEADRGQIRQVLLNLYVNAWQAMPGGGDLYVQTENVVLSAPYLKHLKLDPGPYIKISVIDTGTGMDDATLKKIFDPFFSTKETGQGSGLGLASVYGIIKNHGGFVQVSSTEGEGTRFDIYLPASPNEAVEESPGPDRQGIHYGRETILLVDDEEMILEVGRMMLERLGYRVLVAGSGGEALDLYGKQKGEIDLVVLDMIMPGMGGGETYDRLKAINGDVRVLLSSGYSINEQAEDIMNRGCRGFIQKPFDLEELSRRVKWVLDR